MDSIQNKDLFNENVSIFSAHRLPRRRPIHETLRVITHSYLDICKLIEDVNRTFGTVILVLLLTSLVQLVTMGYYAFMTICEFVSFRLLTITVMNRNIIICTNLLLLLSV